MSGSARSGVAVLMLAAAALCQPALPPPGQSIQRSISPGENHRYTLDTAKGLVRVVFLSLPPGFSASVKLVGSDSLPALQRSGTFDLIFSTAPAPAGTYQLEVSSPSNGHGSGQYLLKAFDAAPNADLLQADTFYAEGKFEEAAALYGNSQEVHFQGSAFMSAAQAAVRQADWTQAASRYSKAAAAFQVAGAPVPQIRALSNLGAVQSNLRDYAKAIETASKVLPLARANHLPDPEIAALTSLTNAWSNLGDPRRALEFVQQNLAASRALGNLAAVAEALSAEAGIQRTLGNFSRSIELYEEARKIHRDNGITRYETGLLNNIGAACLDLGDKNCALDRFLQAAALARADSSARATLAGTLNNLGGVFIAKGDPAKALPVLEEALGIYRDTSDRWDQASVLTNVGRARLALSDPPAAYTALNDALALRREVADPHGEALTRYELARVEVARGNLEPARQQVAQSLGLIETLRNRVTVPDLRSTLLASVGDYYSLNTDILMRLYRQEHSAGRLQQARDAAESGRARTLADMLSSAGLPPAAGTPESEARERKLRFELNDLSARRAALLRTKAQPAQIAALDKRIDAAWTDYQAARSQLSGAATGALAETTLDLNAIRDQALDENTLLLEYSLGSERSYLFVLSRQSLAAYDLPARAQIDAAARAFWDALKSGAAPAPLEQAATRLSRMTIAPAAAALGNKRLLIVADGALQYIPFAALADPASQLYRPLLQTHEIVNEPSGSALCLIRRAKHDAAPHSLAVFADPIFEAGDPRLVAAIQKKSVPVEASPATGPPSGDALTRAAAMRLTRLPATRREATTISAALPEADRWLALDFAANRDAAVSPRLSDYRLLHFATHGILESSHPELSALALSLYDEQGKPQDGFLRLYEIYNLKLRADLVVLSACETALGPDIRGEGFIGLARGFMQAGAPRVAASLWKVDDDATGELMRRFYSAMLGPRPQAPAAALRSAQLALSRDERWRSPYYWAAFVLAGEWK